MFCLDCIQEVGANLTITQTREPPTNLFSPERVLSEILLPVGLMAAIPLGALHGMIMLYRKRLAGVEWPDLYDWLEKKGSCLVVRLMEETRANFRRHKGFLKHIILSELVIQSVIDAISKSQKSHRVVTALTFGLGAESGFENLEKPQIQSAIAHAIQKCELA